MAERTKRKSHDEQAEFVNSFISWSEEERDEFEEIWDETERNFLVRPLQEMELGKRTTAYPLDFIGLGVQRPDESVLKDPETFQEVMTIASNIVLALFPDSAFVKSAPVGFEDIRRSKIVGELLRFDFRQQGHFINFLQWIMSAGIYGTGYVEGDWHFREEPRTERILDVGPLSGQIDSEITTVIKTVYDGPRYRHIPIRKCFPDRSAAETYDMQGFAKEFTITAQAARDLAELGLYDKGDVEKAIDERGREIAKKGSGDVQMGTQEQQAHPDFMDLQGFEYTGTTPFEGDDGLDRRRITLLSGCTVRSDPWPRALPFFKCVLTPRIGSSWGIAPAEIIRFDQDFADVVKMMMADAVVKATHPPHIYDRTADVEVRKLKKFSPRVPIAANDANAVQQTPYNPPISGALQVYGLVKQQMREGTGATDAVQGFGIGTKRLSASEAVGTFERAGIRPEMFASVIEREYLPPIGKFDLELNQEFLEPDDLPKRVGDADTVATLFDILGDFDVEFVGSRQEGNKLDKLSASREIFQASANPIVAQFIPWIPFLRSYFQELGQHEIASMVGDPQMMQLYLLLQQAGSPQPTNGNGNGEAPNQAPLGLPAAQGAGDVIQ